MSEELEPTGHYDGTINQRYPWDLWLNGRPHRLDPASDFSSDPRVFRTYIYAVARKRGLKVVIVIEPTDHIVLQAYDPAGQRPLVPSPYRRLANGKRDQTSPTQTMDKGGDGHPCTICGTRLTPAGLSKGTCHKFNRETGKLDPMHA
jgi:hypothetical protein